MKHTKISLRVSSLILSLMFLLAAFSGCKKEDEQSVAPPLSDGLMNLSGFAIVREGNASDNVIDQTVSLKKAIKEKLGADLPVSSDEASELEKEILIGKTDRTASKSALKKLAEATSKEAYIIDISENKIVIVGTTDNATMRAVKIFKEEYVNVSAGKGALDISAGKTRAKNYNSENIEVLENGLEIELLGEPISLLEEGGTWYLGDTRMNVHNLGYPKGITLQHQKNPEDNGKLIAHLFIGDSLFNKTNSCFVESKDGGKTWEVISRPTEQKQESALLNIKPGHMSHIYELPEQLGKYPAGTLVFACNSVNYDIRSEIWMWYSTDCGRTWKQTAHIAKLGIEEEKGVWEPYSIYDNGYLYCFYSDQTNPKYDQAISFRRSKDGINWEEPKYVCSVNGVREGTGMIIITKMGNGEFFAAYEYYGKAGPHTVGQIYYKKTKDLNDWGDPTDIGTMIRSDGYEIIGAPACLWIPAGGECGTLIVSGKNDNSGTEEHRMMVSNDYGETWITMANPLPYVLGSNTRVGHSPALFLGTDGRSVYYINQTAVSENANRKLEFISFKIY